MIYLSPPHLGDLELKYIQAAISSNWIAPVGENINRFEKSLTDYVHCENALAVNSGTSAIHLALKVLGIQAGDEVVCSSFTFAASANPILYENATPIFVDSETQTWNISPEYLEQAIETRLQLGKKIRAIMVVHLYGNPAQWAEIEAIANKYQIPLIEDAAEALGSSYQGKKLGSLGKIGVYSFNGNKIITTSSGGALVSNDKALIDRALYYATQAKDPAPHYQHSQIGYNYRLSNILAGIGLGQMAVLEERILQRRNNYFYYQTNLPQWLDYQPENHFSNRWLTCVLFKNFQQREHIRLALANQAIESRPLWKPLHLQPVFQSFPYFGENRAEDLFNRGLCLPSGSNLSEEDLERICGVIRKNLKD
jgi:dTDP-4-amino-4,6-dideoxygalactose transaminase